MRWITKARRREGRERFRRRREGGGFGGDAAAGGGTEAVVDMLLLDRSTKRVMKLRAKEGQLSPRPLRPQSRLTVIMMMKPTALV